MSYGPTDPTMPFENAFPAFLNALWSQHPKGAVTERLQEYVDACRFVGRLENLHADVVRALDLAGEPFDAASLKAVRLNEGAVPSLKQAARASRGTLRRMLDSDSDFASRFGYRSIPAHLICDQPTVFLPMLKLRGGSQGMKDCPDHENAVFDHPVWLSDETDLNAGDRSRRHSWQIWAGIASLGAPSDRNFAAFLDDDGTCGHMAASLGFKAVTAITMERRISADVLNSVLSGTVTTVPINDIGTLRKSFDVVLHARFPEARSPAGVISMLTSLLKPKGQLILHAIILQHVDKPIVVPLTPTRSPIGPLTTLFMSWPALQMLLIGAGFTDIERVDLFPIDILPQHIASAHELAGQFDLDPENLLASILIKARYRGDEEIAGPTAAELDDAWTFARPLWVADPSNVAVDAPLRRLADQQRRALAEMEPERAMLRGALADRERDLAAARAEMHAALREAADATLEREILKGALADRERDLAAARAEAHAALREAADAMLKREILKAALADREIDLAAAREGYHAALRDVADLRAGRNGHDDASDHRDEQSAGDR